jgi:TonB family protein
VVWLLTAVLSLSWLNGLTHSTSQPKPVWAVLDVCFEQHPFGQSVVQTLRQTIETSSQVRLLDPSLTAAAAKGFGYAGSLNLSLGQARDLGTVIGCDYIVLGRAGLSPHSPAAGQLAPRAWLGLFIVESRTGRLAAFEFFEHTRATPADAAKAVSEDIQSKLTRHTERLGYGPGESPPQDHTTIIEVNDPDKPTPPQFDPPQILASSKPTFTKPAQTADITATVELNVTFLANGTIGPIKIARWAGFGLDESAMETAQHIKFKPARLNGRLVTARAVVQYKFTLKAAEEESYQPSNESPMTTKRRPSS